MVFVSTLALDSNGSAEMPLSRHFPCLTVWTSGIFLHAGSGWGFVTQLRGWNCERVTVAALMSFAAGTVVILHCRLHRELDGQLLEEQVFT